MALPTIAEIEAAADANPCCIPDPQRALWDIIGILIELAGALPVPTSTSPWLRATSDGTPVASNTDIIAAPPAGFFLRIGYIQYSSAEPSGGVDIEVGLQTSTTPLVYQANLAPRSMFAHDLKTGTYDLPESEALELALSTAGLGVYYTIEYQILPVVV
jgi:hypothetical protein